LKVMMRRYVALIRNLSGLRVGPEARQHLAKLVKRDEEQQKLKKSKQKWNLRKRPRQGATPSTHQPPPVSGGSESRSRDQIDSEPTGETPTQPTTRSRSEEK
jgi:hypothetical protein